MPSASFMEHVSGLIAECERLGAEIQSLRSENADLRRGESHAFQKETTTPPVDIDSGVPASTGNNVLSEGGPCGVQAKPIDIAKSVDVEVVDDIGKSVVVDVNKVVVDDIGKSVVVDVNKVVVKLETNAQDGGTDSEPSPRPRGVSKESEQTLNEKIAGRVSRKSAIPAGVFRTESGATDSAKPREKDARNSTKPEKGNTSETDDSFQNMIHILEHAREAHEVHVKDARPDAGDAPLWLQFIRSEEFEKAFDIVMAVVILLNVLQIGVSADLGRNWNGWIVVDAVFAFAFIVELCYKITAHGWVEQYCGEGCGMNVFDLCIVILAIFELVLNTQDQPMGGVTVLRIVRLLRLGRIFKFLRMPVFSELRAMMDGLIDGSRILFWSIVLLITPIYTLAVIMRETIGESELRGHPKYDHFIRPFGTFSEAFFTSYRCIMGDCSTDTGQPLIVLITHQFGWVFALGFALVTSVTTFGLFNVIAAIYVDNIQAAAQRMEAKALQSRLTDSVRNLSIMGELVRVFVVEVALNNGCDTTASWEEMLAAGDVATIEMDKELFDRVMQRNDVKKNLDRLDIKPENRVDLFSVLDSDGGGSLSLTEILKGFQMLRGESRRTDNVSVGLMLRTLQEHQQQEMKALREMHEENSSMLRQFKEDVRRRHVDKANRRQAAEYSQ